MKPALSWYFRALSCALLFASGGVTEKCWSQVRVPSLPEEAQVRAAVQRVVPPSRQDESRPDFDPRPVWYVSAFVDLAGTGRKQVVVYFGGRGWCGTGGCRMLILNPVGPSYEIIAKIPAVRPPFRLLETKSSGWRDLSAWVQGGGILYGYDQRIVFENHHRNGCRSGRC